MLGLDCSCNRRAIWNGAEGTVLQAHHVLVVMIILKPQYLLITHSKQSVNICQMKRDLFGASKMCEVWVLEALIISLFSKSLRAP